MKNLVLGICIVLLIGYVVLMAIIQTSVMDTQTYQWLGQRTCNLLVALSTLGMGYILKTYINRKEK